MADATQLQLSQVIPFQDTHTHIALHLLRLHLFSLVLVHKEAAPCNFDRMHAKHDDDTRKGEAMTVNNTLQNVNYQQFNRRFHSIYDRSPLDNTTPMS